MRPPRRILVVHNRYRTSAPSGEDVAVSNEVAMLRRHGFEVFLYDRCNDHVDISSRIAQVRSGFNTIWSARSRKEMLQVVRSFRPDVSHVHNTFSIISPSIYGALQSNGVPVVQTLHNYRLLCPGALFLRGGKPCEDCVDGGLLHSIRHRCYRNSLGATATVAGMLGVHRALGTYQNYVDIYISLTAFARSRFVRAGFPEEKIVVKPNFLPDPPMAGTGGSGYVVYVGRILEGKGVGTLIEAWKHVRGIPLRIVGDGALRSSLEKAAKADGLDIEFLGARDRADVLKILGEAALIVVPSECYEGFPMVIAEAFACGTPVVASDIGSLSELILDNITGFKYPTGNARALAQAVVSAMKSKGALQSMRRACRTAFEEHLTEDANLVALCEIYERACLMKSERQSGNSQT